VARTAWIATRLSTRPARARPPVGRAPLNLFRGISLRVWPSGTRLVEKERLRVPDRCCSASERAARNPRLRQSAIAGGGGPPLPPAAAGRGSVPRESPKWVQFLGVRSQSPVPLWASGADVAGGPRRFAARGKKTWMPSNTVMEIMGVWHAARSPRGAGRQSAGVRPLTGQPARTK